MIDLIALAVGISIQYYESEFIFRVSIFLPSCCFSALGTSRAVDTHL
jgi:hypothetical protein